MTDAQLQEAAIAVLQSIGTSAYLHGIDYDVNKFKSELNGSVKYIKGQAKTAKPGARF